MGRWQKLGEKPTIICDTGHNTGGMQYITEQLRHQTYKTLHIVIGMVNDKDVSGVLSMLPKDARYYFTQASVKRASSLPADESTGRDLQFARRSLPPCERSLRSSQGTGPAGRFYFCGRKQFYCGRFTFFKQLKNVLSSEMFGYIEENLLFAQQNNV